MYIQSPIYSDSDDGSVGDMEVDNTNNSGVETQDEVNTGFSLSNTESQSTESREHTNKVSVKSTDTDYIVRVNKESFSTAVNTIATAIQNVGGPVLTNAGAGTAANPKSVSEGILALFLTKNNANSLKNQIGNRNTKIIKSYFSGSSYNNNIPNDGFSKK